MYFDNLLPAFALTVLAGLSTGIGSLLSIATHKTGSRFLALSLGFSAGVMIYVSFVELYAESVRLLTEQYSRVIGELYATLAFFGGILLILVIDRLVPEPENPHEMRGVEEMYSPHAPESATGAEAAEAKGVKSVLRPGAGGEEEKRNNLLRIGYLSALAIAIHNFPEGLATFAAALKDIHLGIPIAVAIAIHNIPEGIAVAVPVFYATGSRKKAFLYSFLSGLAEPLGALLGFLVLLPFFSDLLSGILFAVIAGIMVYISLDELLPAAEKYGEHHISITGLIGGMAVMALSLLLF